MIYSNLLLHQKIAEVCPIVGIAIGDPTNPATWRIDYDPSATPVQQQAAQNAIAAVTAASLAQADATVQAAAAALPNPLASALASAVSSLPTATAVP